MKKRLQYLILPIITLILEILPYGAVCNYARPATDGSIGHFRELYSYFDLTVFKHGNIGPFFCAVLTAVLFGMMLSSMFFKAHKAYTLFVCTLAFSTVVLSLTPTLFGQYSLYGLIVTVLLSLSAEMWTMAYINREKK